MEFNINRLEEYGVDPGTGIEYTGSHEKYINALKQYHKAYEDNRSRVVKALAAMDIDDYTIIVHSLKSNSRMIGAGELSTRFETLELAARAGNTSVLISDTSAVLDIYDTLIKQLAPLDEDDETTAASVISADEAHKTVDELLYEAVYCRIKVSLVYGLGSYFIEPPDDDASYYENDQRQNYLAAVSGGHIYDGFCKFFHLGPPVYVLSYKLMMSFITLIFYYEKATFVYKKGVNIYLLIQLPLRMQSVIMLIKC